MKSSCLLALILLPLNACSLLFEESKAELSDARPTEIDASIDSGLYSLEAKWQTSTQGATGNIGMGPNGILAFAGHFVGTVDLNGNSYVSAGGLDLLLAHLDAGTGEYLRMASFGAIGAEFVLSLSIGADNEMVLGGGLSGSRTNVGGDDFNADNPTPSHGYVARYTTELEHAWSLLYKSNSNNASVNGISAENGAVYVAGGYGGDLSLPDVDLDVVELVGQEGLAAYFGKYDANGKFTGGQTAFSGQGNERCEIAIGDGSNSAYIAGSFSEELTFATTKGIDMSAGVDQYDFFVGRIGHNLALSWVTQLSGNTHPFPVMRGAVQKPAYDSQLVFVSEFRGVLNIPDLGKTLTNAQAVDTDVALFIVEPVSGLVSMAKSFPSVGVERSVGVSLGPDGEIAIVGNFTGKINFSGVAVTDNTHPDLLTSESGKDGFIAVFDSKGEYLWSQSYGTVGDDQALSAVFDSAGSLYVTFRHQAGIDFGLGPVDEGMNVGSIVKFERVQ